MICGYSTVLTYKLNFLRASMFEPRGFKDVITSCQQLVKVSFEFEVVISK